MVLPSIVGRLSFCCWGGKGVDLSDGGSDINMLDLDVPSVDDRVRRFLFPRNVIPVIILHNKTNSPRAPFFF